MAEFGDKFQFALFSKALAENKPTGFCSSSQGPGIHGNRITSRNSRSMHGNEVLEMRKEFHKVTKGQNCYLSSQFCKMNKYLGIGVGKTYLYECMLYKILT